MYFVSSFVFDLTFFCQLKQEQQRKELEEADVLDEGWEYVEDGPAEITWLGNEIIVKKARRKVRKGIETGTPDLEVILNNICQFLLVFVCKTHAQCCSKCWLSLVLPEILNIEYEY